VYRYEEHFRAVSKYLDLSLTVSCR